MTFDQTLKQFHSVVAYSYVEDVYAAVSGSYGFDDDALFSELLGPTEKLFVPSKDTILHDVIRNVLEFHMGYLLRKMPDEPKIYENILRDVGIAPPKWLTPRKIKQYEPELEKLLDEVISRAVPSVFFLLFNDREFLRSFQKRVSAYVQTLRRADHPDHLGRDGAIKRLTRLPTWLKAGVFHRDRARCQRCFKDLSSLLRPVTDAHFDHIIPLAVGGSNDPSNFQLACARCNLRKRARPLSWPSKFTPHW